MTRHPSARPQRRVECHECGRVIALHNRSGRFMPHKCPHGATCNALPHDCEKCKAALAVRP